MEGTEEYSLSLHGLLMSTAASRSFLDCGNRVKLKLRSNANSSDPNIPYLGDTKVSRASGQYTEPAIEGLGYLNLRISQGTGASPEPRQWSLDQLDD
jgi:hypothetical protein